MAAKDVVTKVWIEEGCIVCDACETTCPDVFDVTDDACLIRPEALSVEFTKPRTQEIVDAAEECPVDVIKFETVTQDVSEAEPAPVEATEESAPASQIEGVAAEQDEAAPAKAPDAKASKVATSTSKSAPTKAAPVKAVAAAATPAEKADLDPSIQALLRAATARGGNAGILRKLESTPPRVQAWQRKNADQLPPDARQAKVLAASGKAGHDPDRQRRAFMGDAALTIGWVAFGTGLGISVGPALGRFMMPNVLEEPDPRVRVGALPRYLELVPGEVNEDYKPQGIWMIREEGRIAALSTICTHLGCIPNWLPNDRKFKCPCHGSGFRPDGINFEGPTPRPLERFRIYVKDGVVIVDKSKKYQYELGQWDHPGSFIEV